MTFPKEIKAKFFLENEKNGVFQSSLHFCGFGTFFRCKGSSTIEKAVIGQLVRGEDALCSQYGAGLSVPERFVNRYRIRITDKDSEKQTTKIFKP